MLAKGLYNRTNRLFSSYSAASDSVRDGTTGSHNPAQYLFLGNNGLHPFLKITHSRGSFLRLWLHQISFYLNIIHFLSCQQKTWF